MEEMIIIYMGRDLNEKNKFFCVRCKEGGTFELERDVSCPKCGNHLKFFANYFKLSRMDIQSIDNNAQRLKIAFKTTTYLLKRRGKNINPFHLLTWDMKQQKEEYYEFVLSRNEEATLEINKKDSLSMCTKINGDSLRNIRLENLEQQDLDRILQIYDSSYRAKNKRKGSQFAKAIYFEVFPKMKMFGWRSAYNFSESNELLMLNQQEKDLDFLKCFIPKATKKNMYLIKEVFQKEGELDSCLLNPYVLYGIQKPETIANLFKALTQFEEKWGLNLKRVYALDKLKDETSKIIKHLTPDGYDKSLNQAIRVALQEGNAFPICKKLEEIKMFLVDTKKMLAILEERVKEMKEEDKYYPEVKAVVEGNYQAGTLKKLHDYLWMLEMMTNDSHFDIQKQPWQEEMICTVNDYEFFFVENTQELRYIAYEMNNCISSLEDELVYFEHIRLYGVRKDGKVVFMMKLIKEGDGVVIIDEAKKKNNKLLSKKDESLLLALTETINKFKLDIRTEDLRLINSATVL